MPCLRSQCHEYWEIKWVYQTLSIISGTPKGMSSVFLKLCIVASQLSFYWSGWVRCQCLYLASSRHNKWHQYRGAVAQSNLFASNYGGRISLGWHHSDYVANVKSSCIECISLSPCGPWQRREVALCIQLKSEGQRIPMTWCLMNEPIGSNVREWNLECYLRKFGLSL